eukprot:11197181-Lingulodinium_polyedra.AAC.1
MARRPTSICRMVAIPRDAFCATVHRGLQSRRASSLQGPRVCLPGSDRKGLPLLSKARNLV